MKKMWLQWILIVGLLAALPAAVVYAKPGEDFSLKARGHQVGTGETLDITVEGKHLSDVYAYEVTLSYPEDLLEFSAVESGIDGYTAPARTGDGKVTLMFTMLGERDGASGKKALGHFTFKALDDGRAKVELESVKLVASDLTLQSFEGKEKLSIKIKNRGK